MWRVVLVDRGGSAAGRWTPSCMCCSKDATACTAAYAPVAAGRGGDPVDGTGAPSGPAFGGGGGGDHGGSKEKVELQTQVAHKLPTYYSSCL